MELLSAQQLVEAYTNDNELLREIAENLKYGGICRSSGEFMNAARQGDAEKVNNWLEAAILKYTNSDNPALGLALYCEKFGIAITEQDAGIRTLIALITTNAGLINAQLNAAGI